MRCEGKDFTEHKKPIPEGDMRKLYDTKVLCNDGPVALQRKVFVETGLHFARRGREGMRELRKDSFLFKTDDQGHEYVTIGYNEMSKNHNGLDPKDTEKVQIMYSQDNDLCPVKSLKLYLSKLNPANEVFYQKPKPKNYNGCTVWYENKPLGKNTLGKMMSSISEAANLSNKYTNHCLRATAATVLAEAGVEARNICSVTGHKNESSLKSYIHGPSLQQRHQFSKTLSDHGKSCTTVAPVKLSGPVEIQVPTDQSQSSQLSIHKSQYFQSKASGIFAGAIFQGPTTININLKED